MKNIWEKIKGFFVWAWNGLTLAGRIVAGVILVALIVFIAFAASDDDNKQELADAPKPSIGTPLPPDVNDNANVAVTAMVGGASTTEPSLTGKETKIAPETGVDLRPQRPRF